MTTILSAPLLGPIQFRSLVAQLNPIEITSFIDNLNPEILIDALTCYFIHGKANKERIKHNDVCNDVVSSIIESRDQLPSKETIFKLDALPSGLIGACGSYLDQMSYARLSAANRDIFLGCNTPSTLQKAKWRYQSQAMHELLNFPAVSSVNTLVVEVALDLEDEDELPVSLDEMHVIASQISKLPQLQSLDLRGWNADFIRIVASHETTNQRVNCLTVMPWKMMDEEAGERFILSITAFKHIKFLTVYAYWDGPPGVNRFKINSLIEMCGNLRGLNIEAAYGGCYIEECLLAAGHHLHYLRLNIDHVDDGSWPKNIDFANLQQLRSHCGGTPISAVLDTAINVEKICLSNKPKLIVKALCKCRRLRYLEIKYIHNMETALDALERGLFQTKKRIRSTLKIRINTSYLDNLQQPPISNPRECVIKLDRIINSLSVHKVAQWMIILDLHESCCEDPAIFIGNLWCSLRKDVAEIHEFQTPGHDVVLITNPGCTICGCNESWLMSAE